MEGTRHERIALVIIAYIIGFTTAYIAFGVTKLSNDSVQISSSSYVSTAHAMTTKQKTMISSINIDNDGLFVLINGYQRLLAVNKGSLQASALSGLDDKATFYKIIDAEVSKNGQFAYFCEQFAEKDTDCSVYVYTLADDSLHPAKLNSHDLSRSVQNYTSSWTDNGLIMIGNLESTSSSTPWLFGTSTVSN